MILELRNINKSFKDKEVIKDFSHVFNSSNSYGILGKNGSGKTTLLKIIANLISHDSGMIFKNGQELDADDGNFSYISNNQRSFYMRLLGMENLFYFGALNGKTTDEVIEYTEAYFADFELHSFLNKPVNSISLGQSQMLNIIRGFISEPSIILFDEFGANLDESNLEKMGNFIKNYKKRHPESLFISCAPKIEYLNLSANKIIEL